MAEAEEAKDPLADTNMENYGGKEHRAKQKAIAMNQKEWKDAGKEVGVEVWRIEKFKVVPQKDFNSEFYNGDSYIVLNTYEEENAKKYNVHFWLGTHTSQDEAGSAAIKTVELDDLLGDLPVQYREVQGVEGKLFKQCFRGGIRILEGGVDTGFAHVKPEEYAPRLLHIVGNMKKQSVYQVPLSMDSLNCKDVFVLDLGLELIQFNGVSAAPMEKRAANQLMNTIASERNGRVKSKDTIDNLNEGTQAATKFFATLGIEGAEDPSNRPTELPEESNKGKVEAKMEEFYKDFVKKLYHVENDTVTLKQEGDLDNSILAAEGDDAIIVDVGASIFLWIGSKASLQEKGEAMSTAIKMLADQSRPMETRIVRVMEGKETDAFNACF